MAFISSCVNEGLADESRTDMASDEGEVVDSVSA